MKLRNLYTKWDPLVHYLETVSAWSVITKVWIDGKENSPKTPSGSPVLPFVFESSGLVVWHYVADHILTVMA